MMNYKLLFLSSVLLLLVAFGCEKKNNSGELSVEEAIKFAVKDAAQKKYDTSNTEIEILKVKKGMERGPIRMVTLFRTFGPDMATAVATKEYWVVYFYPKGTMEKDGPKILGGDFTALVDLHSGDIIASRAGM